MGCLKLVHNEELPTLKVAHSVFKTPQNSCAGDYRYGFNGMEKDDEAKGANNTLDFGARMYDPRIGKFLSLDPKAQDYPFMSPYCYAANSPIRFIDVNGEGPDEPGTKSSKPEIKLASKTTIEFTVGPQVSLGGKTGSKGLGLDLTFVSFNIFKITKTETINVKTGKIDFDWDVDFFSGDVKSSAALNTPAGTLKAENKFKIDSDLEYIWGTQKTELSYITPKVKAPEVGNLKGQVTYTKEDTGKETLKASGKGSLGTKTSGALKFILGVSFSSESSTSIRLDDGSATSNSTTDNNQSAADEPATSSSDTKEP